VLAALLASALLRAGLTRAGLVVLEKDDAVKREGLALKRGARQAEADGAAASSSAWSWSAARRCCSPAATGP
jgi:hypothetical protein